MKRLILVLLSIQFFAFCYGQQYQLTGKVTATDGETLIGVSIALEGGTGTITDIDGNYKLMVKPGTKLSFSYIGYQKQVFTIKNQKVLNVEMAPDQTSLDEVVVVAYGKAKRITMTGSVSGIQARELREVPTSSVQNALNGKLPGFFSQQRSGQPGKDASDFFIRGVSSLNSSGNQPLIIVDDVQYSFDQLAQINVNEIESISILKDASTTAVYGIKGANGVLVVKTRRGSEGKPQINVRLESGAQMPIRTPKFLNSYQTATLVNEAYLNDEMNPKFTQADLDAFQSGNDPYGHPDVNWYDKIFKKVAFQENANLDISGGTEKLRYFVSAGIFMQNGLVRDFASSSSDINTNYFYKRYNIRTNLDFDVTKTLNLRLDVNMRFMNINEPRSLNAVGEIYDFSKMRPYSAPFLNPNGSYAYTYDTDQKNPTLNARLANEGYKRTRRNDNNYLFGATQKLDFLAKGLAASFRVAYSSIDENDRSLVRGSSSYPTYHYNSKNDSYTINPNKVYNEDTYMVSGGQGKAIEDLNIQAFLNYSTKIAENHTITSMFLFNRQSRTVDRDYLVAALVPENFQGYTATLNYNYKNKYLIDVNMAYNGTDRFGKDNRYGFFPAVGVAYSISEEPFFKKLFPQVQLFKIRASYGLVGSDAADGDRYLYKQKYERGGGYGFGESQEYGTDNVNWNTPGSIYEGNLGNNNVTWEKAKKFDIGIDANLFDKLSLTVDFFYDKRYDQLVTRKDIPDILGIGVSPTNVAETSNTGFDGQIGYQTRIGRANFNTNFVFSYAKNKVLYMAEAEQRYPWLASTGRPIGQPFGYTWIGYYTPEEAAAIKAKSPDRIAAPSIGVQAGDLKYKDLNDDGVIDDYDKGAIGKPNLPNTTLGWSFGGSYKGFSVSVLFQGSFNYSFSVTGTGIEPFKSQFQPVHLKRWTEERWKNGEEIEFPRLTSVASTINSGSAYMSDFWLIDAWYIRLKTIDLAYQVPEKVLPKFISSTKFYINAYNLLTFTNFSKYQQDPEISTNTAGDTYMNQRVLNFGVQLSF